MGILHTKNSVMARQLYRTRADLFQELVETFVTGDKVRCTTVSELITKNCGHIVATINQKYRRTPRENNRCMWLKMCMDNEALYLLQAIQPQPGQLGTPRKIMNTAAVDISSVLSEITGANAEALYAHHDVSHGILLDMATFYTNNQISMYTQACEKYRDEMNSISELISATLMLI